MAHLSDARSRRLAAEKQSENIKHTFTAERERIAKENSVNIGSSKFVGQVETLEDSLKRQTTGLVNLKDFKSIHAAVNEKKQREAARTSVIAAEERKRKKKSQKMRSTLSFSVQEEGEGEDEIEEKDQNKANYDNEENDNNDYNNLNELKQVKKPKLGKDPEVDTSFLPDREREEQERRLRETLRQEWLIKQEEIKKEEIEIIYSYWDGTGHRKVVTCLKGDTISTFLEKCRKDTPELRNISVDNLMYVKEDIIVPSHLTFYDLIVNKARGKSGPLFTFNVHDDVRLRADATIEKEDSHPGKVLTRAFYERNKHVFPLSRFEPYDPEKQYGKYTIKDS